MAGSGKTTVMAAVRDAFESGGFTGHRHLDLRPGGPDPGPGGRASPSPGPSPRCAGSIDHEPAHLTEGHVLVLDEAGMASDRDIAFLLDHARLAGAKVVMVGDDRQLGAGRVGGAVGALVERHGGAVHALDQNVRQHDQAEREALAELRAGDVARAVEFYWLAAG